MPHGITVRGQYNKKIFFRKAFTRVKMYYNLHSFYFVTIDLKRVSNLKFLIRCEVCRHPMWNRFDLFYFILFYLFCPGPEY
jgi:hypothetical protein